MFYPKIEDSFLGIRKCWAQMDYVTKRDGSMYEDENWRLQFVGKTGWLEIQNHAFIRHTVIFSELQDVEASAWSMETSIIWNFIDVPDGVILETEKSKYGFFLRTNE